MLEKITVVDKIEIVENGSIQIRRCDRILENDLVISEAYHRHVIHPGEDISAEDQRVRDIADAVWTPEVIAAWEKTQS
jgi:hypothetical protein